MNGPRWISWRHRNPAASVRLYCLPYAGGGTRIFDGWPALLGEGVEVCPILLPGREDRITEQPVSRLSDLVPALLEGLAPTMTKPYAIYGHSMGGLVAFELARRLCAEGARMPAHLYVSGCGPKPIPPARRAGELSDEQFIEKLRGMNGTPPEFFEDRDLVDLLLPAIRADFRLSEDSSVREGVRLPVPLTAFAGEHDPSAPPAEVERWREHAVAGFAFHVHPGDHFFIHDCPPMVGAIRDDLLKAAGSLTA
ncbi:alpha/beta fold hydrolase [Nonomuraea sp. NPDC050786]|uniref:thioesterase II family protein n=1 Tax=Nonomuraea sp. NPDC050786 TaxID=3154840 RepID=UPI0033C1E594